MDLSNLFDRITGVKEEEEEETTNMKLDHSDFSIKFYPS